MGILGSVLGGVASLGSAIIGGISASRSMNKANKLIKQQRDANKAWYDTKMSRDYTMRSDVQAAIKRQRELLDEQYKQARATNVVSGGTDESLALQQQAANKSLSDTMTDVAARASEYKDNIEQQYRAQDAALNQQQVQNYQQQAAQTAAAASQAVNSGINMLGNNLSGVDAPSPANTSPVDIDAKQAAAQAQAQARINALADATAKNNAQGNLNNTIKSQVLAASPITNAELIPPSKRKVSA